MFKIVATIHIDSVDYYDSSDNLVTVSKQTLPQDVSYCIINAGDPVKELRIDNIGTIFRGRLPTTNDYLEIDIHPAGSATKMVASLVYWEQILSRTYPRKVVAEATIDYTMDLTNPTMHCLKTMFTKHN